VSLITLDALPSSARFTQEYFINNILPGIVEARENSPESSPARLFVHGQLHLS
jgi:hypothetical protein